MSSPEKNLHYQMTMGFYLDCCDLLVLKSWVKGRGAHLLGDDGTLSYSGWRMVWDTVEYLCFSYWGLPAILASSVPVDYSLRVGIPG